MLGRSGPFAREFGRKTEARGSPKTLRLFLFERRHHSSVKRKGKKERKKSRQKAEIDGAESYVGAAPRCRGAHPPVLSVPSCRLFLRKGLGVLDRQFCFMYSRMAGGGVVGSYFREEEGAVVDGKSGGHQSRNCGRLA